MDKKTDEKIKNYLGKPDKKEELLKILEKIEEESKKNKTYIDKLHDKIFKEIMLDQEEAARFIYINYNIFVMPDELELCNTEFRTRNNKVLEVDILYKIKGTQTFFLIEHQTKNDKYMVYRILNYETEIINRYMPIIGENKPMPMVISGVIFTGKGKWTAKTSLGELQEDIENGIPLILGNEKNVGNYKIIDIKKYNKDELRESSYILDKAYLFEQLDDVEKIVNEFLLSYTKIAKEKRKLLEKVFTLTLSGEVTDNTISDIIKIARKRGGEEEMVTMAQQVVRNQFKMIRRDGLIEGIEQGLDQGREEGLKQAIKGMLINNVEDDIIINSTGVSKKELEKIKKEMAL